jgi:hypothetical protein
MAIAPGVIQDVLVVCGGGHTHLQYHSDDSFSELLWRAKFALGCGGKTWWMPEVAGWLEWRFENEVRTWIGRWLQRLESGNMISVQL